MHLLLLHLSSIGYIFQKEFNLILCLYVYFCRSFVSMQIMTEVNFLNTIDGPNSSFEDICFAGVEG